VRHLQELPELLFVQLAPCFEGFSVESVERKRGCGRSHSSGSLHPFALELKDPFPERFHHTGQDIGKRMNSFGHAFHGRGLGQQGRKRFPGFCRRFPRIPDPRSLEGRLRTGKPSGFLPHIGGVSPEFGRGLHPALHQRLRSAARLLIHRTLLGRNAEFTRVRPVRTTKQLMRTWRLLAIVCRLGMAKRTYEQLPEIRPRQRGHVSHSCRWVNHCQIQNSTAASPCCLQELKFEPIWGIIMPIPCHERTDVSNASR